MTVPRIVETARFYVCQSANSGFRIIDQDDDYKTFIDHLDIQQAIDMCEMLNESEGFGHTARIMTRMSDAGAKRLYDALLDMKPLPWYSNAWSWLIWQVADGIAWIQAHPRTMLLAILALVALILGIRLGLFNDADTYRLTHARFQ